MMKKNTQPLLIVIGELGNLSLSSRSSRSSSNHLIETVAKLSHLDAKIMAIDINHSDTEWKDPTQVPQLASGQGKFQGIMNDFKLICFLTQGRYFTLSELIKYNGEAEQELAMKESQMNKHRPRFHHTSDDQADLSSGKPSQTGHGLKQSQSHCDLKIGSMKG